MMRNIKQTVTTLTPQSTALGAADHPLVNKGKRSTLAHVLLREIGKFKYN